MNAPSPFVFSVMNNLPWLTVAVIVVLVLLGLAAYLAWKWLNKPAESGDDAVTFRVPDLGAPLRLRRSFVHALNQIEAGVPGRDARYRMPWVLMLGQSGSGKSAMLAGSAMVKQMDEFSDPTAGCTWWFFGTGVVIDVAGNFILGPDGRANERAWRNVLRQLVQHRPERPADAIVLTIPASDLNDPTNRDAVYIAGKAERLYAALWAAQRISGIRLPVYVVITKCDELPGFRPFAQALPKRLHDDMLGWSSPYPLETTFSETWVDEALETVHGDLFRLQLELFAEHDRLAGADEVFQFPHDVRRMAAPLTQYLRTLFRQSAYHEAFFLRGVYFTGDLGEALAPPPAPAAVPALVTAGGEPVTAEPVPPWLRLPLIEAAAPPSLQPMFLKHLFEQKIFAEGGIARPAKGAALSQNRTIRATQIAIGATLAFGALALTTVSNDLSKFKVYSKPLLQDLAKDLRFVIGMGDQAGRPAAAVTSALDERMVLNLLKAMSDINFEKRLTLMPSYRLSRLTSDLRRALTIGYDHIVLRRIAEAFQRRINAIIEQGGADPTINSARLGAAFMQLRSYVGDLVELERYADRFNALRRNQNLQDLVEIVFYLFKVRLPPGFVTSAEYYQDALADADFPRINRPSFEAKVVARARDIVQRGLDEATTIGPIMRQGREISDQLRQIFGRGAPGRGVDVASFRALAQSLTQFHAALSDPARGSLHGGPPLSYPGFREMLADIIGLETFGVRPELPESDPRKFEASTKFSRELADFLSGEYTRRQAMLRDLALPVLGPMLRQDGGEVRLELAPPVETLRGRLDRWFEQPFMTAEARPRALRTGGRFVWDSRVLESAIGLAESYILFVADELGGFPAPMQDLVRGLALDGLNAALLDRVAQAQTPFAESGSRLRLDDELRQEIASFRDAAPVLQRLLQYFDQLQLAQGYDRLAEVAINHAIAMLGQAEGLLNSEQLYLPQGGNFAWWSGGRPVAPEAFGVLGQVELPRYLAAQRQRIATITRDYAEPLAGFLTSTAARGRAAGPLAAKWEGIVGALADYDSNRPNNSLATLEKFIAVDMDEIELANCPAKLGPRAGSRGADFFATRLAQLRQGMLDQCRVLSDRQGSRAYAELANAFNQNLAGRFPFVEPGAQRVGDVDPVQLRRFFQLYDRRAQAVRESIGARPQGPAASPGHDFLDRMDAAREFFSGLLGPEGPARSFVLDVDFRVNQAAEIGGREIIEWQMEIADQRVALGQGKKTLAWQVGQTIVVGLRWARNGPAAPVTDDAQPALRVDDLTALFAYEGPWALLDLLTRQALPAGEAATLSENRPHVLKFTVPIQTNPIGAARPEPRLASRVYVRIAVKTVTRSEGKPDAETALTLPRLPARAPELR